MENSFEDLISNITQLEDFIAYTDRWHTDLKTCRVIAGESQEILDTMEKQIKIDLERAKKVIYAIEETEKKH